MEFDEEFSGTPVEGAGEEALMQPVPVNKGPKPKREKKEPGEDLLQSLSVCENIYTGYYYLLLIVLFS